MEEKKEFLDIKEDLKHPKQAANLRQHNLLI